MQQTVIRAAGPADVEQVAAIFAALRRDQRRDVRGGRTGRRRLAAAPRRPDRPQPALPGRRGRRGRDHLRLRLRQPVAAQARLPAHGRGHRVPLPAAPAAASARPCSAGCWPGCAAASARQVIAVIADTGSDASAALHRRLGFAGAGRLSAVGSQARPLDRHRADAKRPGSGPLSTAFTAGVERGLIEDYAERAG